MTARQVELSSSLPSQTWLGLAARWPKPDNLGLCVARDAGDEELTAVLAAAVVQYIERAPSSYGGRVVPWRFATWVPECWADLCGDDWIAARLRQELDQQVGEAGVCVVATGVWWTGSAEEVGSWLLT